MARPRGVRVGLCLALLCYLPSSASLALPEAFRRARARNARLQRSASSPAPRPPPSAAPLASGEVALPPSLEERLSSALGVRSLNPLQRLALPHALGGGDTLVHAETGAGKTLCFALPIAASLAAADGAASSPAACDGSVHALVLSPTLELCAQTAAVLNALLPGCAAVVATDEAARLLSGGAAASALAGARVLVSPASLALALLPASEAPAGGGRRASGAAMRADAGRSRGAGRRGGGGGRRPAAGGRGGGGRRFEEGGEGGAVTAVRSRSLEPGGLLGSLRLLVLDEADALLGTLGKYATQRQKESRSRHPKPAALVVKSLFTAASSRPPSSGTLQLLGASATVGRPLRRELQALSGRSLAVAQLPSSPPGADIGAPSASPAGSSRQAASSARAVGLPSTLELAVLTCEGDNTALALQRALGAAGEGAALVFVPDGRPVGPELRLLRQCGLPEAESLVDYLARRAGGGGAEGGGAGGGGAGGGGAPLRLVASPRSARGLDLPEVSLVVILGLPASADTLLHLAGRTARQGAAGRVVLIATPDEAAGRLGVLGAQLGVDLRARSSAVRERDEEWARTWAVHQQVVQAERKYNN